MLLTIKHNLHLLVAFQSLLFLLVLASPEYRKYRHNYFLALFFLFQMLSESCGIFHDITRYNPATLTFDGVSKFIHFRCLPFGFLVFPFLYLYVLSLTDRDFRLKPIHLVHTLFFVAISTLILMEYRSKGIIALIMISRYNDTLFIRKEYYNFRLLHILQLYVYIFLCFRRLAFHRKMIRDVLSSLNDVSLRWLRVFLYLLSIWGFLGIMTLVIYNNNFARYPLSYIIFYTVFLCIMTYAFLRSLSQRSIEFPRLAQNEKKYERNPLSQEESERHLKRLIAYMEEKQPFLNPDITINDLSSATKISSHTISQVLNTRLNQNFYDFINSYRVKESIRLLENPSLRHKTIIEILFESGFNSKSTFNTAFKKHTGMTPSDFKHKRLLSTQPVIS